MYRALLKEYGIIWLANRILYSLKIKALQYASWLEVFFEKEVDVKRIGLFDVNVEKLEKYLKNLPEENKNEILQEAQLAISGRIKGFSSIELDYGNPIDWHLNPISGIATSALKKWYRIPDFDKDRGDIKVIWEASRFTHFLTFARAFLITGDLKYYVAFSEQLDDWLKNNKYSYGVNYKCGQECSLRMINALFAYSIFNNLQVSSVKDEENIKQLVKDSYQKVLSNFFYAYKCIKNNHTISELLGMIVGAWCCEDKKRLHRAYKILDSVILKQFSVDGGYIQYSYNYQRLALMDLNVLESISSKTGESISSEGKKRLLNSALLLYQCQADNYDVPNYGSNDGALIFKMTSCSYRDFRPVCNTTYKLLTGNDLYENDIHREELIWLGIDEQWEGRVRIAKNICSYKEAGIFVLRNKNSFLSLVSNEYKSRPGHIDQNHIDLWVDDINVFCDCGTYSYASDLGKKLITESSHNTVSIAGKPQMMIKPPFMVYNWTKRVSIETEQNYIRSIIRSKSGYIHERLVKITEYGYEINDVIKGKIGENYCINFHTPCEVKLNGNEVLLEYQGKKICSLVCNKKVVVDVSKRSLFYLKEEKINCLRIIGTLSNEIIKTKITLEEK